MPETRPSFKTTLTTLGFRVFHAENATRSEMDTILTDFENAIPRGGTAVFYFAGHGIEFDGKNYLMGSNAKLQARSRLGEEAMDAETFASAMLVAGAKSTSFSSTAAARCRKTSSGSPVA